MAVEEEPDFHDRFDKALKDAAKEEFIIKWLAVVEILDKDGEKGLWYGTSEDSAIWDTLGMLEFAKRKSAAKVDMVTWAQHQIIEEDEDDEEL